MQKSMLFPVFWRTLVTYQIYHASCSNIVSFQHFHSRFYKKKVESAQVTNVSQAKQYLISLWLWYHHAPLCLSGVVIVVNMARMMYIPENMDRFQKRMSHWSSKLMEGGTPSLGFIPTNVMHHASRYVHLLLRVSMATYGVEVASQPFLSS